MIYNKDVYYSPDVQRILQNYRGLFYYLSVLEQEDKDSLRKVMKFMHEKLPDDVIKHSRKNPSVEFEIAKFRADFCDFQSRF